MKKNMDQDDGDWDRVVMINQGSSRSEAVI